MNRAKKRALVSLGLLLLLTTACGRNPIGTDNSTAENKRTIVTEEKGSEQAKMRIYTLDSTVGEVLGDPIFEDFGHLLFPVDRSVTEDMSLAEVSSSRVFVWYNNIQPEKTVEVINHLKSRGMNGQRIFYPIYEEEEIAADPSKADTGLFSFGGEASKPFAIMNAGGGFSYVGAMHDSFPHALEVTNYGYNGFALIYRPDDAYADLARGIEYLHDHAEELKVSTANYSLWGGSAGARMAATLGNADSLFRLTGRRDIPQATAVVMQYTGYSAYSPTDAPTYANVGTNDGIASWQTMESKLNRLEALGIATEFQVYEGLSHGFGLGYDTVAEGWFDDAIAFWEEQMK